MKARGHRSSLAFYQSLPREIFFFFVFLFLEYHLHPPPGMIFCALVFAVFTINT